MRICPRALRILPAASAFVPVFVLSAARRAV